MESLSANPFEQNYRLHLQRLLLKGLQPKTVEAYARAIRRIGKRFDQQIDALSEQLWCGDEDRANADLVHGLGTPHDSESHRGNTLIV